MYRVSTLVLAISPLLFAQTASSATLLNKAWEFGVGDRPYITTGDSNRSITFNPTTNNLLIVGGSGAAPTVNIVNAVTGADVGSLNMTGITGGARLLSQISVAEDGAIYGTNLTTTTNAPLTIYKWADESAAPVVVYNDSSSRLFGTNGSTGAREGDTLDVRGSGASTQLTVGSSGGLGASFVNNRVAILTPTDSTATAFTAQAFELGTASLSADYRHSIAFGAGNTIYSKEAGGDTTVRVTTFDLGVPSASTSNLTNGTYITSRTASLGVDLVNNLIAFVQIPAAPGVHELRLFEFPDSGTELVYLESAVFPEDTGIANNGYLGDVQFAQIGGATYLYAVSANNGLIAFVLPEPASLAFLGLGSMMLVLRRR
ncbi:MAG: DUF4623 domain-containing protein [Phycisphaerales bacterium]|nr:DUF4623 domain-containing protein [Phycisphaerales bacterium]